MLDGSQGLSYPHKCTLGVEKGSDVAGAVTVWCGGTLLEIDRLPGRRRSGSSGGGGKRGVIARFSAESRRRMLRMISRLREDALPVFVTLTLPDGVPHDGRAAKKYLRRFKERFRRRFPGASFIWRLEAVNRKSGVQVGELVPHYHLLMFGVSLAPGFREWISEAWYGAVASGDRKHLQAGTQVEAARSGRQVRFYASKLYAAKAGDDEVLEGVGRYWGVFRSELLPWAEPFMRVLTVRESWRLSRMMRGYLRASLRRRGKRRRRAVGWTFAFIENGNRWADVLNGGLDW